MLSGAQIPVTAGLTRPDSSVRFLQCTTRPKHPIGRPMGCLLGGWQSWRGTTTSLNMVFSPEWRRAGADPALREPDGVIPGTRLSTLKGRTRWFRCCPARTAPTPALDQPPGAPAAARGHHTPWKWFFICSNKCCSHDNSREHTQRSRPQSTYPASGGSSCASGLSSATGAANAQRPHPRR